MLNRNTLANLLARKLNKRIQSMLKSNKKHRRTYKITLKWKDKEQKTIIKSQGSIPLFPKESNIKKRGNDNNLKRNSHLIASRLILVSTKNRPITIPTHPLKNKQHHKAKRRNNRGHLWNIWREIQSIIRVRYIPKGQKSITMQKDHRNVNPY
jgi:hypothetical protein